ncbi:MAG: acireductone synthase [Halothiobacillaceae bacterium]|jgi:enolase-phosphatase E1|nr:acireductone synthase [Halothiobacillaceae bacterium]
MIKAILTDIEGTTSSLSFVKDVLFPYAERRLPEFVRQHAAQPAVAAQLAAVGDELGRVLDVEEALALLLLWAQEDRKFTPLKTLQGMIWEAGYRAGDFTGHVYPEAARVLRQWQAQGLRLFVYSSGSEQAQRLLFGYSSEGDLRSLFEGYFDTRVGGKREVESYRAIAEYIGLPASDVLFLSDIPAELDAAREAGMRTWGLMRHGDPMAMSSHPWARDFEDIDLAQL